MSWRYRSALWIDKWVGRALCFALLPLKHLGRALRGPAAPAPVRKILVLKMWGMGSIVLASPLLRELRARHPEARIDFVTLKENLPVLRHLIDGGRPIALDLSSGVVPFLVAVFRTLLELRRERYDLLLDLEFFTRFSAIFSFLAGARHSAGFSSKGSLRGRLHDAEIPFNTYQHVVVNFLSLLHSDPVEPLPDIDLEAADVLSRIEPSPDAARSLAERLERASAWIPARPLVVVNPNAGDMALERRWPAERVIALLEALCAIPQGVNVVLTGAPSERDYVNGIVRSCRCEKQLIDLAGAIDLDELIALLARADAVVTNDSGPMHIAAAAGASTVALFGPETPVLYRPLRSRPEQQHVVHYRSLACSPCMFVHDNKALSCWFADALCMRGIAPEEVLGSVRAVLAAPHP